MAEFFRLDGQVALVTGAGRGIGADIARRLHAAGARIAVFDRDAETAQASGRGARRQRDRRRRLFARMTCGPVSLERRPISGRSRSWSTTPGSPAAPT